MNGVKDFIMRNSIVRDSVFAPWVTISGPDAAQWGNENILIENNNFGSQVHFDQRTGARTYTHNGLAFQLAWCENAAVGVVGYKNVTVRFNSTSRSGQLEMASLAHSNCRAENIKVYGNIAGVRPKPCVAGVEFRYNVFTGVRPGGVCHTTDVNIGGNSFRFYAKDTHAPGPRDFRLVGRRAAPDNLVPVSVGCPRTDRFGTWRDRKDFCDAGSHER